MNFISQFFYERSSNYSQFTVSTKVIFFRFYLLNGEWHLLETSAVNNRMYYGKVPYDDVAYYVMLQRRPRFYEKNIVIPTALIRWENYSFLSLPPKHPIAKLSRNTLRLQEAKILKTIAKWTKNICFLNSRFSRKIARFLHPLFFSAFFFVYSQDD